MKGMTMKVVVTGGAGFLGRLLIDQAREIDPARSATSIDLVAHPDPTVASVVADLAADPAVLAPLLADGPVTLVHLASVVSSPRQSWPATSFWSGVPRAATISWARRLNPAWAAVTISTRCETDAG